MLVCSCMDSSDCSCWFFETRDEGESRSQNDPCSMHLACGAGQGPSVLRSMYSPHPQDHASFDADYVKDENSDNGEWKAQYEYDLMRSKVQKMRDHLKDGNFSHSSKAVLWCVGVRYKVWSVLCAQRIFYSPSAFDCF